MDQLMPLPLTVSCSSKIQIGFTFMVPTDLDSPGQRAVKRMYLYVCMLSYIMPSVLWCCWLGGRKGIQLVKNCSGVLARSSVWSEVQTCIWPSWCHCHSLSLASVKCRLVFTWVVPEKGLLNVCVLSYIMVISKNRHTALWNIATTQNLDK